MANTYYSIEFKKMATELVLIGKQSTIETAKQLNIPLKTFEKWITAYNKNPRVFDSDYVLSKKAINVLFYFGNLKLIRTVYSHFR